MKLCGRFAAHPRVRILKEYKGIHGEFSFTASVVDNVFLVFFTL
jgi:hypothetical protein